MPLVLNAPPDLFSGAGIALSGFTSSAPNVKYETKKDALLRAKRLFTLQKQLSDAPLAFEMAQSNILAIEHFIKRSIQGRFDHTCHDGLMRMPHSFEEMCDVPPHEYDAWYRNDEPYKNRLHPASIVVLNQAKEIVRSDAAKMKASLPNWQIEVEQLKARGPLPEDVAKSCKLTTDGELAVRSGEGFTDITPAEVQRYRDCVEARTEQSFQSIQSQDRCQPDLVPQLSLF
jgi:hypothetical protein